MTTPSMFSYWFEKTMKKFTVWLMAISLTLGIADIGAAVAIETDDDCKPKSIIAKTVKRVSHKTGYKPLALAIKQRLKPAKKPAKKPDCDPLAIIDDKPKKTVVLGDLFRETLPKSAQIPETEVKPEPAIAAVTKPIGPGFIWSMPTTQSEPKPIIGPIRSPIPQLWFDYPITVINYWPVPQANPIVQVPLHNPDKPTQVPIPATIMLVLIGIVAIRNLSS